MSKHPPHHPTNPDCGPNPNGTAGPTGDGVDEQLLVDVVAGDPPVPITVWRTARTSDDRGASIPARLARRLVAAYSRPGEAVVDLTADHALATASYTGGRRYHRAWFTDVASLIIGPATSSLNDDDMPQADDELDTDLTAAADGVEVDVSLADWFGDDLTDPHLPPTGPPVVAVPDGVSLARLTSLVVATWPLDPDAVSSRIRLAWLLTACQDLLRPGGCLVLVVAVPAGLAATPEDFSPIATAAAQVGLGYLQHIVAVAADISGEHGDAFVYHVNDEELLTLARARAAEAGQQWTVAHLRVHADLLVFAHGTTGRRRGGSRRAGRSGEATNG